MLPEWPRERRPLPPQLLGQAAANPGGSVAEIDGSVVSDPDGYVPLEAIVGLYLVGDDGMPTGDYLRNPEAGPVRDDFSPLLEAEGFWDWLGDDPGAGLKASALDVLQQQVPGSRIAWMKVLEPPESLLAGVQDGDSMTVTRAGVAMSFALAAVTPSDEQHVLTGAMTLVARDLDGDRIDRTWLDIGGDLSTAKDLLRERIS